MSRKPNTNAASGLVLPNQVPNLAQLNEPKQSAVIITTDDGQKLAYPQVAVAMISPDVAKVLAEAVHLIMTDKQAFYASQETPVFEEASEEIPEGEIVQAG